MKILKIEIIFTVNLHIDCQLIYKKTVCLSNRFFYYFSFAILYSGEKMEDNKLKDFIVENQNLIYSVIHKFRSKDIEDLFQVGCIGLIKAYRKFDTMMNVKFTSYAYNFILGEIYQYIINNRNIRMSPANIKLFNSINKARDTLTNYLGRNPTIEELCSFCEIEPYKYAEMENALMTIDLDNIYNLADNNKISKEDLIDLRDALNNLSAEEKTLINARYFNDYTQTELASMYHTNQVKISREEKKILSKLKANMY